MTKTLTLIVVLSLAWSIGFAQEGKAIDSLKHNLAIANQDTSRALILSGLCYVYGNSNPDSAKLYGERALDLAKRIKFYTGEVEAMNMLGRLTRIRGDMPKALEMHFNALQIAEEKNIPVEIAGSLNNIGNIYEQLKDYSKAKASYFRAEKILDEINDTSSAFVFNIRMNIETVFAENKQLDSALIYLQKAGKLTGNLSLDNQAIYLIYGGSLQFELGNHQAAIDNLHKSIAMSQSEFNHRRTAIACNILADCYNKLKQTDSSIYYARMGFADAQMIDFKRVILNSTKLLAELYEPKDLKQAHYYLKIANATTDSLFGENKLRELQKIISDEQERQRKAEAGRIAYQNQLKQYAFLAGLAILLIIAFILYRNNLREKKSKNLLHEKNKVIENTLTELKSTQSQLIQSEKMASLGELTAGIAHEIQNPLNFVNNFSEVNKELIDEMQQELKVGKIEDAIAISNDIKDNEEKINHHGKRADAIVKGMLQHSSSSSGVKEPTNINALADEYLRLAYHGLRAKDKSFNATMKTDFDESIGNIYIIPQDIGRVLLNLENNAFYAVAEKKKQQPEGYEPTVSVSTKKINGKIEFSVKDNGNGMSQKIVDKIFQPFFTTKPTGEGTGLGLSLSYDIVKAHGGEIKVETKEGEGSEFIIQLPIKTNQ